MKIAGSRYDLPLVNFSSFSVLHVYSVNLEMFNSQTYTYNWM